VHELRESIWEGKFETHGALIFFAEEYAEPRHGIDVADGNVHGLGGTRPWLMLQRPVAIQGVLAGGDGEGASSSLGGMLRRHQDSEHRMLVQHRWQRQNPRPQQRGGFDAPQALRSRRPGHSYLRE
jgi:hypothetical protein